LFFPRVHLPKRWHTRRIAAPRSASEFAEGYYFARYREVGASKAQAAWSELASGAIAFAALAAVVLLTFAGGKVVTSFGITPGGLGIVEGGPVGVGWLVAAVLASERQARS